MRKYLLTFLLLFAFAAVMAQKKSVIILKSSSRIEGIKLNGVDVLKVYNGIFLQDYSTLRSDSAYFYQAANTFDAFGHVNISQGDTLNIYSDKLNYNGNTKIAILTEHVSMVDKDATLTTDYLTYNTATRYGTYVNGGKLVNKDNTLTSKNGYYFANTRDSYFRYDVHLVTPDALIVTDTLRYNSGSRISYFYGPTNIYGKKGAKAKDNDTLYTENGLYNTVTEQAFFGKNNLYRQGTKTLTGDSLFYDRKVGYGRAVKHVIFNDNEQKMTLKGNLATYYKSDERTVVTEGPYGTLITEETDTSKVKSDSLEKKPVTIIKDSTLQKAGQKLPGLKSTKPIIVTPQTIKGSVNNIALSPPPHTIPVKTDTLDKSTFPYLNKAIGRTLPQQKPAVTDTANSKGKFPFVDKNVKNKGKDKNKGDKEPPADKPVVKTGARTKNDTLYYTADTLQTQIVTYKALKDLWEKQRLARIVDTSAKKKAPSIVYTKAPKVITLSAPKWITDTSYLHRDYFGTPKPKPVSSPKKGIITQAPPKKLSKQDSLKMAAHPDSVYLTKKVVLSDTSRVRILSAFHHTKIFKSDLQAKSDSAFYSTSDSTIRMFVNPIIWTQGSQLSGDTIDLQLKNKKMDNLQQYPAAFIVNIEKGDSVHFNQIGGKKMRGFFKDGKLDRMFVDGNAESISFPRDSAKKKVSDMHRSLSSRIRVNFRDGSLSDITFLAKPEHRFGPLGKFTEDDKVLKGFIWKPKERPVSKESIIPSLNKNYVAKKAPPKTPPSAKKPPGAAIKAGKDTSGVKPPPLPLTGIKAGKDSTVTTQPKLDVKKDSAAMKIGKDTATVKKPAALKVQKDTSKH